MNRELITPWVTIAGHPALLFDLEARRLYAFGAIFTAADTLLLLLMLLFLAFSLFFFTSLYGRLVRLLLLIRASEPGNSFEMGWK